MKAIKNMNGFIKSLRNTPWFNSCTTNGESVNIRSKESRDFLFSELRKMYLDTHRVSYLNINRCDGASFVIDVNFY